jgi:hypothetical protein
MLTAVISLLILGKQGGYTWTPYTSKEGRYSVDFPGKVESLVKPVATDLGQLQMYTSYVDMGPKAYMMMYNDYPTMGNPSLVLPAVWSGQVKGKVNLKVLSKQTIKFQGKPAIEGAYQYMTGTQLTTNRVRIVLSGKRLYQQMAIAVGTAIDKAPADRYFSSFKLR